MSKRKDDSLLFSPQNQFETDKKTLKDGVSSALKANTTEQAAQSAEKTRKSATYRFFESEETARKTQSHSADPPQNSSFEQPLEQTNIQQTDPPLTDKTDPPPTYKADPPPTYKADPPPTDKTDPPPTYKTDPPLTDKTDPPLTDETDTPPIPQTEQPTHHADPQTMPQPEQQTTLQISQPQRLQSFSESPKTQTNKSIYQSSLHRYSHRNPVAKTPPQDKAKPKRTASAARPADTTTSPPKQSISQSAPSAAQTHTNTPASPKSALRFGEPNAKTTNGVQQKVHKTGAGLPGYALHQASNSTHNFAHKKMTEAEDGNVATETSHKAEQIAEGGVQSALRFHRDEIANKKKSALRTQKSSQNKPAVAAKKGHNSVAAHNRNKINAQKVRNGGAKSKASKKTAAAVKERLKAAGKAVVKSAASHPIVIVICLLVLLVFVLTAVMINIISGSVGAVIAGSYLVTSEQMDNAELAYSEWETELEMQLESIREEYPDYDEYRINTGEIGYNPHQLVAYLTARYSEMTWNMDDLQALFDQQYTLEITESIETRYADPDDADEDGDTEPYDWYVLTATLTGRTLDDLAASTLTEQQYAHYTLLTETNGFVQRMGSPFAEEWQSHITSPYGYRIHPTTGELNLHRGVDIAFPEGTQIRSVQAGTVIFSGTDGNYGKVVVIENEQGVVTKYAHCSEIFVAQGELVTEGQVIAAVGNTGRTTGPHLHLEVLQNGQYVNPELYVK